MKRTGRILFAIGLAVVAAAYLPCLLLGENAIVTYHDQLDGEMIAYILQAKHLWDGNVLPEFLGGAAKTALTPPAPGCVLLFRLFTPFAAWFLMQLAGSLVGYTGMYLLVKKTVNIAADNTSSGRETEAAAGTPAGVVAGILYGLLPFLPVYGLSQFGVPLLVWCVLCLRSVDGKAHEKSGRTVTALSLAYGAFFALNSSLVLVGFAVLAALALWIVRDIVHGRRAREESGRIGGGSILRMTALWAEVAVIYCLTNARLLAQILGSGESGLSHKAEYVLAAEEGWSGLVSAFLYGGQHSADYHLGILGAAILLVSAEAFVRTKRRRSAGAQMQLSVSEKPSVSEGLCRIILLCLGCNLIFAAVSWAWNSGAGVALRAHMGALGAFQADRFLWLAPCLWYLIFGCCVSLGLRLLKNDPAQNGQADAGKAGLSVGALAAILLLFAVTGLGILKNSDVKSNIQKLRDPEYGLMSYSDYYALGVYDQVRDYLRQETGMEQDAYRVVSLGIDPAAALYHGFYCLDGYSNNYSLEYKHAFRRIIAPALEQSEYLRAYYDEWGNRCYLFGTESPGYYTIEKNGFFFRHLELDPQALRELGGDYLFSAAYIANSDELGLALVREEPFETAESYYRIFLYEVADGEY